MRSLLDLGHSMNHMLSIPPHHSPRKMIRQENDSWLNLQNGIVPSVGVTCPLGCQGIITPLAIDNEAIFIGAWFKAEGQHPLSIADRFQRRRLSMPIIESTGGEDSPCAGVVEAQCNLALC